MIVFKVTGEEVKRMKKDNRQGSFLSKVRKMDKIQKQITAIVAALAIGTVSIGGYLVYDYLNPMKPIEVAEAAAATENTGQKPSLTEPIVLAYSDMPEGAMEERKPEIDPEEKKLTLVGSSMEKDLKIKVQNGKSKLVSGEVFEVSVTPEKKSGKKSVKTSTYTDKDKDGIIYIDKMTAGNYKVELKEVEGYEIAKGSISVKVKDKLEYKKVDIADEVKSEKDVNSAVEDTAKNDVPKESEVKDTEKLLESTVTTTEVKAGDVNPPAFTKASASSEKNSAVLVKKTGEKPTEPPEPTDPTEPPEPTDPTEPPEPTDPTEPPEPTEPGEPSEAGETEEQMVMTLSLEDGAGRAAATEKKVTVSLPKKVTLYHYGDAASTSYSLELKVEGDSSIIKSVTWKTSDKNQAALSSTDGMKTTVKNAVLKGNATAQVSADIVYYADETTEKTAQVQTEVCLSNFTDTSVKLKDKSGNALYIDSEAKTPATLKDYGTVSKFYTSPQYTGWQTIDGKLYYYGADHKPVTGKQVIGGVMYNFASDGTLKKDSTTRGIDVSKWQANIDWKAVAASGVDFAIIRAGYRGASTGALIEDPYFKKNIAGATKAGIKVGVYFFTQAITEAEAVEEASMAMSLVSGYKLSYPIFIDTESASNGRANGLGKSERTAIVNAFCRTVASGGYKPGVYASKSWYNNQLKASSLSSYCIWVAQYNSECTYGGKYNMWQYSDKGKVPGIKGNVDMNISYM